MPGLAIMAATSSMLWRELLSPPSVMTNMKKAHLRRQAFFGSRTRLRRPVIPGDQLILKATVITNRRGIYKFSAEASVDNQLVGEMLILCAERKIDVD